MTEWHGPGAGPPAEPPSVADRLEESVPPAPPAGDQPVGPGARRPHPGIHIPNSDLWRVGFRSFLLQALWNPERMQGQGFAFALRPIARRLKGRDQEGGWLVRHLGYFNTNPALAGCALGIVTRIEAGNGQEVDADSPSIENVKTALGSGLAAVGDPLFWSTLRPLAAILGILWLLEGSPFGPLIFLFLYNGFHLYARFRGVFLATRAGLPWLQGWMRFRLSRLRSVMQVTGVLASAAMVHSLLDHLLVGDGPAAGLWLGAGMVLGFAWGDNRQLSPTALGIGIFLLSLAWASLSR